MVPETEPKALHILGKALTLTTPHTKSEFSMRKHVPKKDLRPLMTENNNDDNDKYFRSIFKQEAGVRHGVIEASKTQ